MSSKTIYPAQAVPPASEGEQSVDVPEGYKPYHRLGGFIDHAGPYFFGGHDGAVYRYCFQTAKHHANPNGTVHGGALVSFVDTVMGSAAFHANRCPCATVTMNTEFLRPTKPGALVECEVELVRNTRSMCFVRATLTHDNEILMTVSGVMKLFPSKPPKESSIRV